MMNSFPSRTARVILLSMITVFAMMRVFLSFFPTVNLNVGPYNIHHLFTGILLLIAGSLPLILRLPTGLVRWFLAAVVGAGLAMVLDQWVYLIVTDGSDQAYLSLRSAAGAALLMGVTAVYITVLAWRKPKK